jgi:hypothetical protein
VGTVDSRSVLVANPVAAEFRSVGAWLEEGERRATTGGGRAGRGAGGACVDSYEWLRKPSTPSSEEASEAQEVGRA